MIYQNTEVNIDYLRMIHKEMLIWMKNDTNVNNLSLNNLYDIQDGIYVCINFKSIVILYEICMDF